MIPAPRLCFTGHRPDKLGGYGPRGAAKRFAVSAEIHGTLARMQALNPGLVCITGMAQGVDQLGADVALLLGIPVIAAVPCFGQESPWPAAAQAEYHRILARCVEVNVLAKHYSSEAMQERNMWMVNRSDYVLAIWDGSRGGTRNCVLYAQQAKHKPHVIIIDPNTL